MSIFNAILTMFQFVAIFSTFVSLKVTINVFFGHSYAMSSRIIFIFLNAYKVYFY